MLDTLIHNLPPDRPVLIAGPTAAGKSALALAIAQAQGGIVINADALQVYENWRILTARPSESDLARAPHALYGHVPGAARYSVGHWLRDVAPLLASNRPIIIGGTGLYFTALTEGLADIPPIPADIRQQANTRLARDGLASLLAALDRQTAARIDQNNPARVQRAWEVQKATGRGLAAWQDDTPAPLLPRARTSALVLACNRDWLAARIETRFDRMLEAGALDEVRANLGRWDPALPSSRAIGAAELVAYLQGKIPLAQARERAIIASRQYAKRQRSWFRARMADWQQVPFG